MIKIIKKGIFCIIILILFAILACAGYFTYVDANASEAKKYLLEKYEINEKDWHATSYTEFVYEDIADCNSLWLKKCTTDKNLLYQYTFKNKEKDTIIVSEDIDGNFSDNYNGKLKEKAN